MAEETEREMVFWQIQVRAGFNKIVEDVIERDTHSSKSEFIRQAVREKLERLGIDLVHQ